jgi:hypothetical protein
VIPGPAKVSFGQLVFGKAVVGRQKINKLCLIGSMSSRDKPYHNAQAGSFMQTLKVEEVYCRYAAADLH